MTPAFLHRLQASSTKRVGLPDLKRLFFTLYPEVQNSPDREGQLLESLRALQAQGAIELPAAASWERVGAQALPKWVALVRERQVGVTEDYAQVPWVPEMGFWTKLKPAQLDSAKSINAFLLRRRTSLFLAPIKERSLEIFDDEKKLDALRTGNTLFTGQLQLSLIGAFVVPLPLPYRKANAPGKPILVVENHNSFWSFGEWNQHTERYSAVVYGAGEAFRSTGAALTQVLHEVQGEGAEYFGDLDPKGVSIPLLFNQSQVLGSTLLQPALDWYAWMLDHGVRREKPEARAADPKRSIAWLGEELGSRVQVMWKSGQWMPQEALGYEQLTSREHGCGARASPTLGIVNA